MGHIIDKFLEVFTTNTYVYETQQSLETLRSKIEFVIQQQGMFDFKYNLTGLLSPDHTFTLWRRAGAALIDSWDRHPVTIKGRLEAVSPDITRIEVSIKPNFIYILFPVVFGVIGLAGIIGWLMTRDRDNLAMSMMLIVIPIMWGFAKYEKTEHQSEFEKALDLPHNVEVVGRTIRL